MIIYTETEFWSEVFNADNIDDKLDLLFNDGILIVKDAEIDEYSNL